MAKVSERPTSIFQSLPQSSSSSSSSSSNMFISPRPVYHTAYTSPANFFRPSSSAQLNPSTPFINQNPYHASSTSSTFTSTSTSTSTSPSSSSSWHFHSMFSSSPESSHHEISTGTSAYSESQSQSPPSCHSQSPTPPSSHPITPPTPSISIPNLPNPFPMPESSQSKSYHSTFTTNTTSTTTNTPISSPSSTPTSINNKTPLLRPSAFPLGRTKTTPHISTKKSTANPKTKHQAVQLSLELKVERSKGFHSFFVPLARPLPGAPPSSPVLGASSNFGPCNTTTTTTNNNNYNNGINKVDSFSLRSESFGQTGFAGMGKVESREQWVEDVGRGEGMDVDV